MENSDLSFPSTATILGFSLDIMLSVLVFIDGRGFFTNDPVRGFFANISRTNENEYAILRYLRAARLFCQMKVEQRTTKF